MPQNWDSATFHLGINMAGAVSAGAYTAGVLDFLMEAVEQWYAAKAVPGAAVPRHNLSIDVFSGASAGGMCAAIAAVMVQGDFAHISDPADASVTGTTNKFYESWVNKIDIQPLLGTADLTGGKPLVSLLDSTIIDQIADYALSPPNNPILRPYISESLTLFLALTNVRGVPFSFNGQAPGSAEEDVAYYGDRLQFETVQGAASTQFPGAKALPLGSDEGSWPLLKEAAKATGAFPIFLAPRQLSRVAGDYTNSPWEPLSVQNPDPVPPHWPLKATDGYTTLNVDGGVTDNDPFELAHDYLALHNPLAKRDPETGELLNPAEADAANCAVVTVAPFPADDLYNADYDFVKNSSAIGMLSNLFTVMLGQSRFLGESLSAIMTGTSFSRFVLAPSDTDHPNEPALQCATLGAFGGFFARGFRAHDYQLGRRNCQKFLVDHFRLSLANPIVESGLSKFDPATRAQAIAQFGKHGTMPIIPLCGTAQGEVPAPGRSTITQARINDILGWIVSRLHAVAKPLLGNFCARWGVGLLISTWGKGKIKELMQKQLKSVISG